jgi:cytochrome c-type biogenesis protein CcsB
LLGYAADCAYGNHAAVGQGETQARLARRPALVSTAVWSASARTVAVGSNADDDDRHVGAVLTAPARRGPARVVGTRAIALTVIGWVLQGGAILARGLSVHRLPWGNMYEFALGLTFAAVTAFLVNLTRQRVRFLGVFVMTPVLLGLGLAITVLYVAPAPLVPALQSYWLAIHVTAAIVASGILTVGTAATVMYLIADRYATATASGRAVRLSTLARMLPAPAVLDRTAYRAYVFAFPLWTFAVVAGAIWAEAAWGHYWQWDPKETWSFITWVVFACYLHARATRGWRGRAAAYVALLGFVTFLFNFFGVNMVLVGMHSYAGV